MKEKFVKVPKKADYINLELDSINNQWMISIDPKVTLIEKNKALRIARSLPVLGFRLPNGKLVGKSGGLTIIGE